MRQKRQIESDEEKTGSARWLLPYSDFITLMFAFFVVMYAVSSVNDEKYKVFATHINAVFSTTPKSLQPVQLGEIPHNFEPLNIIMETDPGPVIEGARSITLPSANKIAMEVQKSLKGLVDKEIVKVEESADWIEIELKSKLLFYSGTAKINSASIPFIEQIANAVKDFSHPIQVEGFTDNLPIYTSQFSSNWDLSSVRAASVVYQLNKLGIEAQRLSSVGYGENFPVADNSTIEGRDANRRVIISIAKEAKISRFKQREYTPSKESLDPVYKNLKNQADIDNIAEDLSSIPVLNPIKTENKSNPLYFGKPTLKIRRSEDGSIIFNTESKRNSIP